MIVQGREVVRGVDVSDWQRSVDHQAVKDSGVSFLVAKATEGRAFAASTYRQNRQGAVGAGLVFGAYHWLKPNIDPGVQARWFLDNTNNGQDCAFLVLDAEEAGITDSQVTIWCDTVAAATGKPVVIYCGAYTDPKVRSDGWSRYTPWLAAYPSSSENPDPASLRPAANPAPWGRWDIWQYSSSGRVPGINGLCDVNVADAGWFAGLTGNTLTATPEEDDMAGKWHRWVHENQGAQYAVLEQGGVFVGKVYLSHPDYATVYTSGELGPFDASDDYQNNGGRLDSLPWLGAAPAWADLSDEQLLAEVKALPEATVAAIKAAL